MLLTIAFALLSFALIAIYSALERAIGCYNKLKVEVDKKQDKRYAVHVDNLSQIQHEVISALYIGRTFAILVFGVCLAFIVKSPLIGIALATFLVLIFAVILPFAVSSVIPNLILESFYRFADFSYWFFAPFIKKRKKNIERTEEQTSEDIQIFQNALNFSDVILRECMVPRTEICAVPENASFEEILARFADSNFSRIIVYRENIDRIIGYVHSKDLFNGQKPVKELIRDIDYLSETTSARELLTIFTKNKRSIAVVLDEYGGTSGIVTLEDLIEEIFGEISDELDKEEYIEKKISENEYLFSARIEIKYLNRTYDFALPESDEYETLAGMVTFFHQSIPSEGEILRYKNYQFKILKTTSNRVETIALRLVEE